jgi:hypothetical protein
VIESERRDFVIAMDALAAAFRLELTEPQYEAYWIGLSSLSLSEFRAAVTAAIASCRFMPVPAELRDLAGGESTVLRAERGWAAVHRAIGTVGRYRGVAFEDDLIHAVLRVLGGWSSICTAAPGDIKFIRKDFLRLYSQLAAHGTTPAERAPILPALDNSTIERIPARLGAAPLEPRLALVGATADRSPKGEE